MILAYYYAAPAGKAGLPVFGGFYFSQPVKLSYAF